MKRLLLALCVIIISIQSCSFPATRSPAAELTSTSLPTLTFTPAPTSTPTATPIPTFTPTPAPETQVTNADRALFWGDYDSALSSYTAAQETASDPAIQAASLLGEGRVNYLKGEYPNALNELRAVTEGYPGSSQAADAYYFLGETYMQLARYADAADAFASYLAVKPGILDAFINERRADALFADSDYSGALTAYLNAVQAPRLPTNFSLELKLAQTYVNLGDYATAGVVYEDVFTRTSSNAIKAQVDYSRGQMYATQGQSDQATKAYIDAVYNFPQAYYSYLCLVELVNSDYPVSDLQRGLVDFYAGQYGVALSAIDRYLALGPTDVSTALYYKGLILRDQNDISTALSLWDQVIQGDPTALEWTSAWEDKAYTQWAYQGDFTAAEKTLLEFVTKAPASTRAAEFLFNAGRMAERDERLTDAAKIWQRLPVEYPNSEYAYRAVFLAAICQYRLGDYTNALSIFLQAQSVASTLSEKSGATFWVGKSQAANGDATSARATWQAAVGIDPTGYYSERSRDLLSNLAPFTSPKSIDLTIDKPSEILQAEQWMVNTFHFSTGTDFSTPGSLVSDSRFIRGHAFWELGLTDQAEAEFNSIRDEATSDPLTSYRLAVYLSDIGMYRQAILSARQVLDLAGLSDAGTLTAPLLFSHIRFGAYYPELVEPAAKNAGVDPLFVWSTLRQESLFDPSIQSSAGAIGLMQIMPVTGADIAARLGWPIDYTQADLLRPDVNLTLGIEYLTTQRDALGGDLYAALAAYNGGPGNAAIWLSLAKGDPDLFVEVVRYDETRQYLMGIYEVYTIYSRLYGRAP